MPRDPFSFQSDDDSPLTLTRSPESQTSMTSSQGGFNELSLDKDPQSLTHAQLRSKGANISARNDLHPYVQTLSLADVDSCVALENAAFPENERCSREKVGGCAFVSRRSVDGAPMVGVSESCNCTARNVTVRPHVRYRSIQCPRMQ